eukprot:TRINITY_DN259_c0_g1_i8.p1 TRINITY_DN259_c0_g1~~TRINITY_DN259_c0_g1_i8.p1  ORF type:complete len:244 (+),score=75.58 TRINITY_DN259_c0_g1_i8:2-733(+)
MQRHSYCLIELETSLIFFFFFQAEDGIRDFCLSRGLGDVYKRQVSTQSTWGKTNKVFSLSSSEKKNQMSVYASLPATGLYGGLGLAAPANYGVAAPVSAAAPLGLNALGYNGLGYNALAAPVSGLEQLRLQRSCRSSYNTLGYNSLAAPVSAYNTLGLNNFGYNALAAPALAAPALAAPALAAPALAAPALAAPALAAPATAAPLGLNNFGYNPLAYNAYGLNNSLYGARALPAAGYAGAYGF